MMPGGLLHIKKAKLNFGNTGIGIKGVEHILDILPQHLEHLDLSLDAIQRGVEVSKVLSEGLSRFINLKYLRLSLILCDIGDEGLKQLLSGLSHLVNL